MNNRFRLVLLLATLLWLPACSGPAETGAEITPLPTLMPATATPIPSPTALSEFDIVSTVMAEMAAEAPPAPEFYADPNAPPPQWVQVLTTTVQLPDTALLPVDTTEAGRQAGYVMAVFATPAGDIWVGDDLGAFSFDGQSWRRYDDFAIEMPLVAFAQSPEGDVLGTGCAGIHRFTSEGREPIIDSLNQDPEHPLMAWCSTAIATTADGAIWITQADIAQVNGHGVIQYKDGVSLWHGKSFEAASQTKFNIIAWPFSDKWVQAIATGPDGNLLLTIDDMIITYRNNEWWLMEDYPWETFADLLSLAVAADNTIWAGTEAGFIQYDGQRWTHYDLGSSGGDPIAVGAIAPARDGSAWMITTAGLAFYQDGQAIIYAYPEDWELSVFAAGLALDRDSNLWISAHFLGLLKVEPASLPPAGVP
ncbi:MAG: hypothetical protein KDE34_24460 [Anaerolineales bacterium]|nr:hypothetical protein [Anaerolineales bacterium]